MYWYGFNVWVGIALVFSLAIRFINRWLLTKTGLASVIVTVATFFMPTGLNLGLTRLITGSVATPSITSQPG